MPLAQLNGIERYYQETGSGDALLLINGLIHPVNGDRPPE